MRRAKIARIKTPQDKARAGHIVVTLDGSSLGRVSVRSSYKELRGYFCEELTTELHPHSFVASTVPEQMTLHLVYEAMRFMPPREVLAYRFFDFGLYEYGKKLKLGDLTIRTTINKRDLQKPLHRRVDFLEIPDSIHYEAPNG